MSPSHVLSRHDYDGVIFDLDGVVTRTADVHAASWKQLFDEYLEKRSRREGSRFVPFDLEGDYLRFVDGKPRYDGVKSFLESRGIQLSWGSPEDGPDQETICGLGNRKNLMFHKVLKEQGAKPFDSTVALIRRLRAQGVKTALVSSSKNAGDVLKSAGLTDLFQEQVDGRELARLGLNGKPEPDMFLEAARRLGVSPKRAVVVEDAISGVQAGSRGGFALVIGVDRAGQAKELARNGATYVVSDLAEVTTADDG